MDLHANAVLTVRQRQRVDFYNRFRPTALFGGLAPLQRVNNLPGTYS